MHMVSMEYRMASEIVVRHLWCHSSGKISCLYSAKFQITHNTKNHENITFFHPHSYHNKFRQKQNTRLIVIDPERNIDFWRFIECAHCRFRQICRRQQKPIQSPIRPSTIRFDVWHCSRSMPCARLPLLHVRLEPRLLFVHLFAVRQTTATQQIVMATLDITETRIDHFEGRQSTNTHRCSVTPKTRHNIRIDPRLNVGAQTADAWALRNDWTGIVNGCRMFAEQMGNACMTKQMAFGRHFTVTAGYWCDQKYTAIMQRIGIVV